MSRHHLLSSIRAERCFTGPLCRADIIAATRADLPLKLHVLLGGRVLQLKNFSRRVWLYSR